MTTPNTGIPYVPENTLNPAAGLNTALNVIDALVQTEVINMNLTAPPGSPQDGDLHIVASPATGAWEGQENNLARYVAEGSFWQFFVAGSQVHLVVNRDDLGLYRFDDDSDGSWSLAAGLGDAPVDGMNYVRRDGEWEEIPDPSALDAEDIDYDNTSSGIAANNVQDAIDEIAGASGVAFSGARVRRTTSQAAGADTVVDWDTEDYDTNSYHDNSTNPSRLTAPSNGYYSITGSVEFSAAGNSSLALRINGSTRIAEVGYSLSLGANARYTVSTVYFLNSGDYVEFIANKASGGGNMVTTNNGLFFTITRLR